MSIDLANVKALVFDVFGTVVDYRGTIIQEGEQLNRVKGLQVDWAAFADAWRARYQPGLERVLHGEDPWMTLDTIHRRALDELLEQFRVENLTEAEKVQLNRVWHRLHPWSDVLSGLTRLRTRYILATLSNGNVSLLVNMARYSKLPWDMILSAELARAYKPDPRVYQLAPDLLDLQPGEIMLVAAHIYDLQAASEQGLGTVLVPRPGEDDPRLLSDTAITSAFDLVVTDFEDLATKLGV